MKVNIYISKRSPLGRRPGIALVRHPLQLPLNETWAYLRSGDTSEFALPEAVEEEIERRGIWSQCLDNVEVLPEF
jgi:hypothetical protein